MKEQPKNLTISKLLIERKAADLATLAKDKMLYCLNLCVKYEWEELAQGYVELIKKETPESNLTQAMMMYSNKFGIPYYIVKESLK